MPEQPQITWTVSMDQANLMLGTLGKQKFDRVADLIVMLRNQAGPQIQKWQEEQNQQGTANTSTQMVAKPNGDARQHAAAP